MSIQKKSRILATVLLLFAILFFVYAVTHPTASFPWSNSVTYKLYGLYLLLIMFLYVAPFEEIIDRETKKKHIRFK